MREILFRGKRTDNGKWIYGWFCGADCPDPFDEKIEKSAMIIDNEFLYWHKVDSTTVGQYTRLCDKTGKKVFENDVMEFDAYGCHYIGIVTIVGGNSCIHCSGEAAPFLDDAIKRYGAIVIGNIHDNPELLKGEEHEH